MKTQSIPTLKKFAAAAATALLLAACAGTGSGPVPDGHYRVQRGDTLYRIAKRYGQSVSTLAAWNNLRDTSQIEAGQVLRVRRNTSGSRSPSAAHATAERAVAGIQALDPPADAWITGQAASQDDFRQAIVHGLPKVVGVLLLASFALLFLMTGSVLVPFKALLINAVSLAASLGVLVWVFQGGHLRGLLGFTPIGGVEAYVMVTAVGVGFGLAMDYEVFILARIKEYWDGGDDNNTAVERGLQRSGGVVTSAALIMMIVFLGFVSGDLLIVKEIGLALAVMVALDATVVRMLLVPAIMSLLGRWNWWAPGFLQNVRDRYTEGTEEAEEAAGLGMSTRPSAAV